MEGECHLYFHTDQKQIQRNNNIFSERDSEQIAQRTKNLLLVLFLLTGIK